MKISGFTFSPQRQNLGYPFVPAIRSLLPLWTNLLSRCGPCDDDTEKMVRAIGDPKIRIVGDGSGMKAPPAITA